MSVRSMKEKHAQMSPLEVNNRLIELSKQPRTHKRNKEYKHLLIFHKKYKKLINLIT